MSLSSEDKSANGSTQRLSEKLPPPPLTCVVAGNEATTSELFCSEADVLWAKLRSEQRTTAPPPPPPLHLFSPSRDSAVLRSRLTTSPASFGIFSPTSSEKVMESRYDATHMTAVTSAIKSASISISPSANQEKTQLVSSKQTEKNSSQTRSLLRQTISKTFSFGGSIGRLGRQTPQQEIERTPNAQP